jgi:hypothetical protein
VCADTRVHWYSMSKQSGNECEAREEDAASAYGYTGTLRTSTQVELKRRRALRPW